jgi:hypothetical protein
LVQANGTQGVLVFSSRTEVRPTFCLPLSAARTTCLRKAGSPRGLGGGFNEHSLHARVSCREETPDSTFNSPRTLSPFLKGDAFRCRQATKRRGLWCSAVVLKSNLRSSLCPPSPRGTRSIWCKQTERRGFWCSAVELKFDLCSSLCPPSSRGTRSVADMQRNAGGYGVRQSN